MPGILVVDDNHVIRALLTHILRDEGYDAYSAGDGEEALSTIRLMKPSVVVTDFYMPVMDGEVLVRKIKEDPELRHIVVVGLAGTADSESRLKSAGVSFYLQKPLHERDFLFTIQNAIRLTEEFQ